MTLRVTVCELRDDSNSLAQDWEELVADVKAEASDLVLLPEMPFHPWFANTQHFDPAVWQAAVVAHDDWHKRLDELGPANILGSRPMTRGNRRLNERFAWDQRSGCRAAHSKYYLPEEEGWWEASWYQRGDGSFTPIDSGASRIGFSDMH